METYITRGQTPEERELTRKLAKLDELQTELAQRELGLATLQAELHTFEARYLRVVGVRYAELDEINAQIAEAEAGLKPEDEGFQEQAAKARAQAKESAQATDSIPKPKKEKFRPSDSLKGLYRELAKHIHPDLATDEEERALRQKIMSEANRAYEEGDEAKLRAILDEWETSPESVKGEGTGAELVRVIRKIHQIQTRLQAIESEISELKASDLFQLKEETEVAEQEGHDLLSEMASRVEEDIALARKRLAKMLGGNTRI